MIIYADGAIWEVPDDILIYVHEEQEEEEQMETKEEMIPYPGPTMVLRTIIDTMLKSDDILVRNQAGMAKYELERLEEALKMLNFLLTDQEEIKEALFKHFWQHIQRGITSGLAEWYKDELAKSAFEKEELC